MIGHRAQGIIGKGPRFGHTIRAMIAELQC